MPESVAWRQEMVALSALNPRPENFRVHDLAAIRASLERFGFVSPVVASDGDCALVAGHGRVEVLRRMKSEGRDRPLNVEASPDGSEWMVPCVIVSFRTSAEALAYLLADNRTTELASNDDAKLSAILGAIAERDGGLAGVGYDDAQARALLRRASGPGGVPEGPPPAIDEEQMGETEHECPECGLRW